MSIKQCSLLLLAFLQFFLVFSGVESLPPNNRYGDNSGAYNELQKSSYSSLGCSRPLDPILSSNTQCFGGSDSCQYFYPNSVCDYTEARCKCRCNYRWDYSSKQCLLDQDYNTDNCWFCSSTRRNYSLPLLIILLVLVIIIAVFSIPTCVAVTCFKNKS